MRTALCCVLAATALVPTPIGRGPLYHPRAAGPTAAPFACAAGEPLRQGARIHLELFANRRVVIVPAGIGVAGAAKHLGNVVAGCHAELWTLDPTGVVWFEQPGERLGAFFQLWGWSLAPSRLLAFDGHVSVYVNGRPWHGDPRDLVLRDRAEVVLEVGGYVPPHAKFLFPPLG
ncbi:MAG TPA: hypothetical protein VMB53_03680 [Gaiellaceae bacterium]|nr:hypothetical protein [Gaiellaceae bacterium]